MGMNSKALGKALAAIAIAAMTTAMPAFAQEGSEPVAKTPAPSEAPPDAQPPQAPLPHAAPVYRGPARFALAVANVNLRSGPDTNTEIVTTIPGGSTVRVTACNGEWCAASWNGRSGFVIARALDTGERRQVRRYRAPPRYGDEDIVEAGPPVVYGPPVYPPPVVVYGPPYYDYYGPRFYYRWGWGHRW